MTGPVLQKRMAYDPLRPLPLPGVRPLRMADWLIVDDAHAGQMARRDALIAGARDRVVAMDPAAGAAAVELLDLVLGLAYPGAYPGEGAGVRRRDGVEVAVDRGDPMGTLGRLVQEDLCILQKRGDEHVLTAAVLCFPASWSLDEKFLRPLGRIHAPVAGYDAGIARRVQRLFDGVQPGRPLWRFNALWYADPELYQPRREAEWRPDLGPDLGPESARGGYLRSERQAVLRLPESGAVVFSIHTYVLARADAVAMNTQNPPGS